MKQASYIREWRESRNLKQEQLAETAGLSKGYMSDLERGKKPYNQRTLETLANILKCSPADLLAGPPGAGKSFPEFDTRLLSLSLKNAFEEALPDQQILTDFQRAKVIGTAIRIYQAYTASSEFGFSDTNEH